MNLIVMQYEEDTFKLRIDPRNPINTYFIWFRLFFLHRFIEKKEMNDEKAEA